MTDQWRGRRAGLAVVAALVGAVAAISVAGADDRERVVVTDPDGRVLASVPLGTDGTFSLRYRNSLYGSLAAERFMTLDGGGLALDALGAEQLAVLEEYYAVESPPVRGADGWWYAPPAYELELPELRVAATDLGRRTLLVDGRPQVDLWRLVRDARPSVIISVEAAP